MTLRDTFLLLLLIAVCAFGGATVLEIVQVEKAVTQALGKVETSAEKIDASVRTVACKIDGTVDHLDSAVQQTTRSFDKAVGDALNPLPAGPGVPSAISTLFKAPAPASAHAHQDPAC